MSCQESSDNRHLAVAHMPNCRHDCVQVNNSEESDAQMSRLLTCYAYEDKMVLDVNPEMVDYTSVNDNGRTHHQDANLQRTSRGAYTSSQTAAGERNTAVACHNTQHANSKQTPRHTHVMNSSHRTDLNKHNNRMVPMSKTHHCNDHGRRAHQDSHHSKTYNTGRSLVKQNKQHRSSRRDDPCGKESAAHREKYKACRHHPKDITTCSSATSEEMNALQVNVEFEVDSSSSTCAAMQNLDIEGVVAVNATVCQSPRNKGVKGSSYGTVGGSNCKERNGKTATEMNEVDVCIESNVAMSYKKKNTNTQLVASNSKKHHQNASSKHVLKNCPVIPVGRSPSPTTDMLLTLNSEVQLSYEVTQDKTNALKGMKECCGTIRDEIIGFKENGDLLKVVKNEMSQMYFKMGQRNFSVDKKLPNLKPRHIFQGYEKKVTVKTKTNCAGQCNECRPTIRKYSNVNSLQEKKYSSEPVLKRSLKNEDEDTLPQTAQSASDYWNRGKAVTDTDVGIRTSTSSDWDRRESMSEREAVMSDSASSGWNRRESMSDQERGLKDSASSGWNRRECVSDQERMLNGSASGGWNRRESVSDQEGRLLGSASSRWNRRESMSDQEKVPKGSAAGIWNRRESMSDPEGELKGSASGVWNRRESVSNPEGGLNDSASSGWNRRESMSHHEGDLTDSASGGWNRRELMSEQEVFNRDSVSSSWDGEKPVPVGQDFGPLDDRVSDDWIRPSLTDVDVGLKYSTSNDLVTDENQFDKMYPSSEDSKKAESHSVEKDGEKYFSATSRDGRDNMPQRGTETKEVASNRWDIEESIPEEEGIEVVDPLPEDWDSHVYNADEKDLGTKAPVSGDFNTEESVKNDRGSTLHDSNGINSNQDKPDIGLTKVDLDVKNKSKIRQSEKNVSKEDPASKKGEATQDGGRVSIVDTVVDYLKRGIFLSSEDDNLYRKRHLFSRRIGRDVLTDVGGIDASGILIEDKNEDKLVSGTEGNRDSIAYEALDRVPSFRSTLDETTTLVSRPQMDRLWNHGHTTVYLGDRVSYFEMPSNDKEMTESVPSSSENVPPISNRNNMVDEVSAILRQIDLPYISKVGSDIRNRYDIHMMPTSSWGAEYGVTHTTNMWSLGNVVPVSEFGMNYLRNHNAISSNVGHSQEVEKTSFLQKIYNGLGAIKRSFNFSQTSGAGKFNETISPSSYKYEPSGSTAGEKPVQFPKRNCSDKTLVNFMTSRENFGRSFNCENEPHSCEKHFENGPLISTEDNSFFPNDKSHSVGTNAYIEEGKPTVKTSTTQNRTREVDLDSELNNMTRNCEQNGVVENSETVGHKTRHSKRKKHSSENISESVTEDDSHSSSSEECLQTTDAESDVNEEKAASTTDAGTKEEIVPFQGIRGYPTRLYPITLYCLCVLLLYLFWTTCYFSCTYTSYGLARRSNTWYCRLYRSVKDTSNYTPEIHKVGHGKLFHPFRPW